MIVGIVVTILLVLINAFFVAAEFAIVKVRSTQIDLLVKSGKKGAHHLQEIKSRLDMYLSASQVGITLASLGLGWVGESTMTGLIVGFLHLLGFSAESTTVSILSIPLAFAFITILHIVIGEQLPKYIAIDDPLNTSLRTSRGLRVFYRIFSPFIWLLGVISNKISALFGVTSHLDEEAAHDAEELRIMMSESEEEGLIKQGSYELIDNVFDFDDRQVKQIYTPRQFVSAIDINWTAEKITQSIIEDGYSRYPVYDYRFDESLGILYTKDFMKLLATDDITNESFRAILRPSMIVPLTQSVQSLLKKMQQSRTHLCLVQNEFGGIVGLITMEDIIEELIGDVYDESDDDTPSIIQNDDGSRIIQGSISIVDLNDELPLPLVESDNYTTLAGYLIQLCDRMPRRGEVVEDENYCYTVQDIVRRQIRGVHVEAKISLEYQE